MKDPIERLRERWLGQGLALGSSLGDVAIDDFEALRGFTFAPDVRRYLRTLNGLPFEDSDDCRLFALDELERVGDWLRSVGGGWAQSALLRHEVATFFIFGDYNYSIAHWAVKTGPTSEVVIIDNPSTARRVAACFDEFLSVYATEGPDALL